MPRYLGLDLHGRYVHGCEWKPEAAEKLKERHFQFPNTSQAWSQFAHRLDHTCWVALEVTGSAFEAHDRLSQVAGKVLLANPIELKRLGSGRHTDRVDATRLAKMLALG
jgi:transposase